jgi:hypothetical protein
MARRRNSLAGGYGELLNRLEQSRGRGTGAGSSPVGRSFPGYIQPGGGPEVGRPALGYDRRSLDRIGQPRTMEFRDRNENRIDDRDEPGGSHYNEDKYKRILENKEKRKADTERKAAEEAARPKTKEEKIRDDKGKKFENMLRSRMGKY